MIAGTARLKELIETAKEGSRERRKALLRDITDVFLASPKGFSAAELQHFDVIMSRVAEQAGSPLRREIAAKLADAPMAPAGLIRQLANDEIEVAEEILKKSAALSEKDLIRIVRQRSQAHLKAIAMRRTAPEKLTSELVEHGEEDVLAALAANRGAKFADEAMERLIHKSRIFKALQQPMTERFDLPPQLLTKLYFFVPQALKEEILKRSDMLDPALIDEAINSNRQKILNAAMLDTTPENAEARSFMAEKIQAGAVDEILLKELIETRRNAEFVMAFSYMTGLDTATGQSILQDKTWEALAAACRAAGLDGLTFAKIVFGVQRGGVQEAKALRILDRYLKLEAEAAEKIMRFWRVRSRAASVRSSEQTRLRAAAQCAAG